MRGHRFDRILAGSALALVLGVSVPAMSQSVSPEEVARVESRVPVPDTTLPPAPTAVDATKPVSVSAAASAEPASTQSIAPASEQPAAVTAAPAAAPTAQPAQPAPVAAEPAATQPATEPAAKPVVAAADQDFSDKLRELITGRNADRYFARRNERTGAEAFYKERDYAPLFVANGKRSEAGTKAVAYLERVDEHGMEPSDYQIPSFKEGDLDGLAEAELRLAGELLQYVRHASMGRVHYTRVHNDIGFEREAPEPEAILKAIADSKDLKATLDSYQPPHPQYQRLKAKLAEARGKSETPAEELVRIPDGPSMKVNASDPRVPLLRKRLKVAGDETSTVYDQAVVDAVKAYQQGAGLPADGVAGPATFRALNAVPKRERNVDIIIANMDRWRWFGRDLGKSYVLLNIPEFRLRLFRDGKLNWIRRS
jgi:murein L,D-transpeptidase YcbB/YkuD